MSTEQATRASEAQATREGEARQFNTTSAGNSLILSIVLFLLLFGLFVGGLYVMSLFTLWTFVGGMAMSIVALFLTFDLVPRFLA